MDYKEIIESKYNSFKEEFGFEPQMFETSICWKDDCELEEDVIISWGDGESDPHDEQIFFHVGDWTEIADLFNKDNGEDFVCLAIEDSGFGYWLD